jgi:flagellar protein FlgJ
LNNLLLNNIDNSYWSKQQHEINKVKSNINKNTDTTKNSIFQKMLNDKITPDGKVNIKKLNPREKKLYNSCIELESFLWKNVLNAMKKTTNKFKLIDGGQAEEIFTDFLYDEYSMLCAKSSSNLATTMFKQLSRKI